jgi:diguanylate cyclase (GGDEF)-like protein
MARGSVTEASIARPGRDALTGLADRAQFQAYLDRGLAQAIAAGHELALIVLDIDRFTRINHTFGQRRGDALLVAVARRVSAVLGRDDFLARLDGDEFAVVACFPGDARAAALTLAERILATFGEGLAIDGHIPRAEATIGVACAPTDAGTPEDLLRFAGIALYAGKKAGRNRIGIFNEQLRRDLESCWIIDERLRDAVEGKEIDVRYQPILNLRTGNVAGVEALARWWHPLMGDVPPDQFIRIAEESHLIRELDRQVLTRACDETRAWIRDGAIEFFSVNLSPLQVRGGDDSSGVLATLATTGTDPGTLVLEVTERLMLLDSPEVRHGLEALRAKGIRLALDDFGSGFSNLSYLNRFPIDRIKIDRSLVVDIEDQDFARIIVQSVTDLAHRLGLLVIVEGVETVAQRQILSAMGCDYAQGFWFSRALPVAEMDALLRGPPIAIP